MRVILIALLVFTHIIAQDPLDDLLQSQEQATPHNQEPPKAIPDSGEDIEGDINPIPYSKDLQTQSQQNSQDALDALLKEDEQIAQDKKEHLEIESEVDKENIPQNPAHNSESPSTPSQDKEVPNEKSDSAIHDNETPQESQTQDNTSTQPNQSSEENPVNPEFLKQNKNFSRENLQAISPQALRQKMIQCEEKADQDTCFEVGMLFYQGRSIYGQQLQQALYFFDRSCDIRRGLGCYEAGIISANSQSYQHAFIFLEKSCQSGDLRGCKNLGILYYNGQGTPKNIYKATEIFKIGCDKGDRFACQKLYLAIGNAYQESFNYSGAKKNFKKACELGDAQACQKMQMVDMLEKQLHHENVIKNNVLKKNNHYR